MGRPRLPIHEAKTEPLRARATKAQYFKILENAQKAGLDLSNFIVEAAVSKTVSARLSPDALAELKAMRGEIGKIGSNINQLARAEHRGREIEDLDHALKQLNKINRMIINLMKK